MALSYLDIPFEEALLRAPASTKPWISYLNFKQDAKPEVGLHVAAGGWWRKRRRKR